MDGIVIAGSSTVDESIILGEPKPTIKVIGDNVFSLSINQQNPLIIKVLETSVNTLASQIARLIYNGQALKVSQVTGQNTSYFYGG